MAEEPSRAGKARDHLANERTLLSWVRTGVGLLSVGIALERAGVLVGKRGGPTEFLGVALALLGCLTLMLGTAQFLRNKRLIESGRFFPSTASYVVVAAASLALAAGFVVYALGS